MNIVTKRRATAGPPSVARRLRESKGLTPQDVADQMRVYLGEKSRHFTSVTKIERDGTYKVTTIRAYADAIGWDFASALAFFESQAEKTSRQNEQKKSKIAA